MPSSDSDMETPEKPLPPVLKEKPIRATPKIRHVRGVDIPKSRRINFDLSENDED